MGAGPSTRDVLEYMVELISSNLIQLAQLNEQLQNYRVTSPNTLSIKDDSGLVEMLEATVDLRLKIVEVLRDGRKYVADAVGRGAEQDLLRKLRALAEFYVYAGVKVDRRVADKYSGIIVVDGLRSSIDELYDGFSTLLSDMGVSIIR